MGILLSPIPTWVETVTTLPCFYPHMDSDFRLRKGWHTCDSPSFSPGAEAGRLGLGAPLPFPLPPFPAFFLSKDGRVSHLRCTKSRTRGSAHDCAISSGVWPENKGQRTAWETRKTNNINTTKIRQIKMKYPWKQKAHSWSQAWCFCVPSKSVLHLLLVCKLTLCCISSV